MAPTANITMLSVLSMALHHVSLANAASSSSSAFPQDIIYSPHATMSASVTATVPASVAITVTTTDSTINLADYPYTRTSELTFTTYVTTTKTPPATITKDLASYITSYPSRLPTSSQAEEEVSPVYNLTPIEGEDKEEKIDDLNWDCGFTINKTTDRYFALFTDSSESDFLHSNNLGQDTDWDARVQNVTTETGFNHTRINNIVTNPLRDNEWSGVGEHWGEPGLQLIARPLNDTAEPHGHMQASVVNDRENILYGSFRAVMSNVHAEGTRTRFFWYSKKTSQQVGFTFPAEQGNVVELMAGSAQMAHVERFNHTYMDNLKPIIVAGDDTRVHEYRFDWLPDRVDFYIDSFFIYSSPSIFDPQPGEVRMDLWSSNLPQYGAGPDKDTIITVAYAKLYFNVTADADSKTQKKWDDGECQAWDVADRTEVVPSQYWHADYDDKTFFFSKDYTHKKEALKDTDSTLHLPESGAGMLQHNSLVLAVMMIMVGFAVLLL